MPSSHLVHDLPPFDAQRNLRVVVETPRGANIKIKYDEDLGCFSLSRILPLGVTYPYDFGFVPQTLAHDGDPLDVLVLIDARTYPGVVISCRLLGALHVEERGFRGRPNHRLVAVPTKAARKDDLRNFSDLGRRMQQELERFFVMSSSFTSKDPVVRGWVGPDSAFDMVERSIARYKDRAQGRPLRPDPEGPPPVRSAPRFLSLNPNAPSPGPATPNAPVTTAATGPTVATGSVTSLEIASPENPTSPPSR